jgi:hypothetical protein
VIPTWLPVVGFALTIVGLLVIGKAHPVRILYPLGALGVGVWLFLRGPGPYLSFSWILWHVSPGIRRIVDYQLGGWEPQNPMSLTPFLVSSLAILGVLHRLPELVRRRFLPWAVAALCLIYGYFVGVIRVGLMPATHALVSWFVPLAFGLYAAVEWRRHPEIDRATRIAFVWGSAILAVYGIYQFVNPPEWDRLWMVNSGMYSVGRAFPYEVRVFSLVNAPLPFATILVAGLFIALAGRGPWRAASLIAGSIALLLSLVRSVWLAGLVGFLVFVASIPVRAGRRVLAMVLITAAVVGTAPLLAPPDIAKPTIRIVRERLLTFTSLGTDVSFRDRASFLENISEVVAENPLGHGLGSTGVSSTLGESGDGIRDFDNGVFAVLYTLGWFGGSLFLIAAMATVAWSLRRTERPNDLLAKAARAVAVTSILLAIGANVFEGVSAAVLWGFAGLVAASHQRTESVLAVNLGELT